MRLRTQLLTLQAPLALAIVVLAGVALHVVDQLDANAARILRRDYQHKNAIHRLQRELARLGSGIDTQAEHIPLGHDLYRLLDDEVMLHVREPLDAGEPEKAAVLESAWHDYAELYERFAGGEGAERKGLLAPLQERFARLTMASEALWLHHDAKMLERAQAAAALANRMRALAVVAAVIALLVGIAVAARFSRRLTDPIRALADAARRVSRKDFSARVAVRGDDELAALAQDFGRMSDELARFESLSVDELVRARQALQAAIDSLLDPVLVFEPEGDLVHLGNRAAQDLLGLAAGHDLSTLPPRLAAQVRKVRGQVLQSGEAHVPRTFDEAVPTEREGGEVWYLARAMPIRRDPGRVVGASVMLQDVTRFRRVDQLRSDMVSTVAHELKTPLTSLQMAIGMVEDELAGPVTGKQAELLRTARVSTTRLRDMVAELLDLSRLQGDRLVLDLGPRAVERLVEDGVAPLRPLAQDRGVALAVDVEPALPSVRCDEERVKIVFANLVSNAIRYTPTAGQVNVRARREDTGVRFEVEDTGAGIPPALRAQVFEKFFRVPGSPKGGAGLGLWITREIVAAHGGWIRAEGGEAKGTKFVLWLPADAS